MILGYSVVLSSNTSCITMGQGTSSSTGSPFPSVALHVLRVADHSPAHEAGIQPFFDYLIGVEILKRRPLGASNEAVRSQGIDDEVYEEAIGLSLDPGELARVLEENEDREIGLRVYNAKSQRTKCEFRIDEVVFDRHSDGIPPCSSLQTSPSPQQDPGVTNSNLLFLDYR